ncbi:MAG: glucosyltransferase domain-containing protein [Verrucomicrobia bacterium]|nr:glucosyltransferase domain-containing protein [Verrucomicrobiota bacterium]
MRDSSVTLPKNDQLTIGLVYVLHLAVLYPLLAADRYHVDDWGRAVLGYFNWANDARPWADSLMRALDQGAPFVDCSPLPQLLALFCIALTATFIGNRFGSGPPLTTATTALLLGANPFYLANLSFKFDSLPMSLALLLAAGAVLVLEPLHKRPVVGSVMGVLFLYGSLCLYQPCANAFLVLVTFELLYGQRDQVSPYQLSSRLLLRLGQMIVAVLSYKLLVASHIKGEYALEHAPLIGGSNAIAEMWSNTTRFWSMIPTAASGNLRFALLLVPSLAFFYSIGIGIKYVVGYWRLSFASRALSIGLVFTLLAGFVFATPGVLIFIKIPTGGARTYVGVGVLLFLSACLLISAARKKGVSNTIICCLAAFVVLPVAIFGVSYANATKTQKSYESHIANLVSDDLLRLQGVGPKSHLTILGDVGFAPTVRRIYLKKYPFLGGLVPIDLRSDASGGFGNTVLRFWGVPFDKYSKQEDRERLIPQLSPKNLITSTPYYDIHLIDQDIVLQLKPIQIGH